jgi:hypothetical protein
VGNTPPLRPLPFMLKANRASSGPDLYRVARRSKHVFEVDGVERSFAGTWVRARYFCRMTSAMA